MDDNRSGGGYAYRASKSALNIINKSMSIDLEPRGITCVLLHPGEGCFCWGLGLGKGVELGFRVCAVTSRWGLFLLGIKV